VGNIGNSFADAALKTTDASVIAAEISSFQLETTIDFHPQVSAVLNLTPDHLDRHGSFENYALCKMDIAKKQTADEYCVINYEDEYLRELAKSLPCKAAAFSSERILDEGAYLEGDNIVLKYGEPVVICRTDELNLLGKHNFENVMAAVLVAFHMGVSIDIISKVVKEFKAVEHRIEYVCTKGGVKYYNDSKGTNTDASSKAIDAMPTPCILIAGGYDKGADFTDWINGFGDKVAEMILIGQTAGKIRETAEKCGYSHVTDAADLKEAVDMAAKMAAPGMCVLLSPACASWGQFSNYEQRGRMFKEYAESIQD
ncbi:MAG: UDP-N-acetylmuramoyl-L-alanine--D-glutamate ligase, partial [Parasporobacterium sp.]|nr:UDP-N-acetylmuramoyl-L-alanine--D-glutamate ligase [Parasporobacterium sp.]